MNKIKLIENSYDSRILQKVAGEARINPKTMGCPKWFREFYLGFLLFVRAKTGITRSDELKWRGILTCGTALKLPRRNKSIGFQTLPVVTEMFDTMINGAVHHDCIGGELGHERENDITYFFSEEEREFCQRAKHDFIKSWDECNSSDSLDEIDARRMDLAITNLEIILRIIYWQILSGNDYAGEYITDEDWDIIDQIIINPWSRARYSLEYWLFHGRRRKA